MKVNVSQFLKDHQKQLWRGGFALAGGLSCFVLPVGPMLASLPVFSWLGSAAVPAVAAMVAVSIAGAAPFAGSAWSRLSDLAVGFGGFLSNLFRKGAGAAKSEEASVPAQGATLESLSSTAETFKSLGTPGSDNPTHSSAGAANDVVLPSPKELSPQPKGKTPELKEDTPYSSPVSPCCSH